MNAATQPGLWIGASVALGRDVPVDKPYPHICGVETTGRMTGRRYRLQRRDCAACGTEQARRTAPRHHAVIDPQRPGWCRCGMADSHTVHHLMPISGEQHDAEQRRLGERPEQEN
jgi:hypothetical protein